MTMTTEDRQVGVASPTAAAGHSHTPALEMPSVKGGRGLIIGLALFVSLAAVAVAVVLFGVLPQRRARAALVEASATEQREAPRVLVGKASIAPAETTVVLPARIEAAQESPLYPQIGGYLSKLNADIGDEVKAGDVLAEISTPVLNEQIRLNQVEVQTAQSRLAESSAQVEIARITRERLKGVDVRAVTQQAVDDAEARLQAAVAAEQTAQTQIAAAEAMGRSLAESRGFARIVAPFDGEISQRGYDAGALVIADKTDTNRPIYRVVRRDELRVFIDVPQSVAMSVQKGQRVDLLLSELPGRTFEGEVSRLSAAVDAGSRTLLVEARVPNPDRVLRPGMFGQVSLRITRTQRPAMVPGEALIVRASGVRVAVIGADGTLSYHPVKLGRDFGSAVEALEGLTGSETIALNLAKELPEGTKVQSVSNQPRP